MDDWMDLNDNGVIDASERMFADEMLCSSREEHMALFGNEGDFGDDTDDLEDNLLIAGLDRFELGARMRMKDVKIWKMPGLIRMIMISFRNRNTQKYPRFPK